MLLIRGLSSKEYALPADDGLIGCRDLATAVLGEVGPTGYAFSGYYERLFCSSLYGIQGHIENLNWLPQNWNMLFRLTLDPMVADSYLTFFHVVEPEVTDRWLRENYGEDSHFIFYEPQIDLPAYPCVYGNGYCGSNLTYLNAPNELSARETSINNLGLLALIDEEFDDGVEQEIIGSYLWSSITAFAPLFNRIRDERFDDRENEFRLMARGKRHIEHEGVRLENLPEVLLKCDDEFLRTIHLSTGELALLDSHGEQHSIGEIAWKYPSPILVESFKQIDVRDTALRCGYIGNRNACRKFVRDELRRMRKGHFYQSVAPKAVKHLSNFVVFKDSRDEKDVLIRTPDAGFYSFDGPGVKVEACLNPMERGLFDPISAYTSALEFVIGTEYPDECMPLPRDGAHEFLHSSLGPWLPMELCREIPEESIEKELQLIKQGRVELGIFTDYPPFSSLFDVDRVRERLDGNITRSNMETYLQNHQIVLDDPAVHRAYEKNIANLMRNFDTAKHQGFEGIIRAMPVSYKELVEWLRVADFKDESCVGPRKDFNGFVAVYRINPDDLVCDCAESGDCKKSLSFSLNPVIPQLRFDLSKFSYAVSPQLEWTGQILGAAHSIQKAALVFSHTLSKGVWRLSCTCCSDRQQDGALFINLRPYKVICRGELGAEKRQLISDELGDSVEVEFD